jgi:lysophospholipase L1-like esterase
MRSLLGRRALGLLTALLAGVGLVGMAGPASAGEQHHSRGVYLALGDSVPFGYRGGQSPATYAHASNFVGYPELLGDEFGLRVLNASCPGETTASFIDVHAQSNGCENAVNGGIVYRDHFPLHVNYKGSQLAYALHVLHEVRNVRLITLTIGANDAFVCEETTADMCRSEIASVVAEITKNVNVILSTLRTQGHYRGPIVVVDYYALDYSDPAGVAATELLNAALIAAAQANHALVASGFDAFKARALAAGGSSIAAGLVLPNDVHPTRLGQHLLSEAVERVLER